MLLSRRHFAACGAAAALTSIGGRQAFAADYRTIPQRVSARVIADNDYAGDPDALVALAHQLLTPKTRTVLITSSALDRGMIGSVSPERTAAIGAEIAQELIRRGQFSNAPMVVAGSELLNLAEPESSPAAQAIVTEAMRDDPLPLIFTCGGPLTNLAAALKLEPRIAERMSVIWIGGGRYPLGNWEYNLSADLTAARIVIEQSQLPLWQVPQNAYRQMQFSVAELEDRLRPISDFSAWLYERFNSPPDFVDVGGAWPMGDSPPVLLSAISSESSTYVDRPALRILPDCTYGEPVDGRAIRVFETLDARLTFEDYLSLMRLHARIAP